MSERQLTSTTHTQQQPKMGNRSVEWGFFIYLMAWWQKCRSYPHPPQTTIQASQQQHRIASIEE